MLNTSATIFMKMVRFVVRLLTNYKNCLRSDANKFEALERLQECWLSIF